MARVTSCGFSDIALLLTIPALWLESALLASMGTLGIGALEYFLSLFIYQRTFC